VSYDHSLLFEAISLSLHRNPSSSLGQLAEELDVSRRTIQHVVVVSAGMKFRELRQGILLATLRTVFLSEPNLPIKQASFKLGYESARSFARAIKCASGMSPEELRASIGHQHLKSCPRTVSTGGDVEQVPIQVS
jgi:methylphosphotriester-DNA--protein-cysteine methyltransferase